MKYILYITIFLSFGTNTYAQERPGQIITSQNKEAIKQTIESKTEALQPIIFQKQNELNSLLENKEGSTKIRLPLTAQERISKTITIIFERFEAFVVRYDTIIKRIENRIAYLETQNSLVSTSSKESLLKAKQSLTESAACVIANKTELNKTITTQTSPEILRLGISTCRQNLQNTHESLLEVIKLIKENNPEETFSLE